ncbi:MAG: 3-dehydroquinate synthase [Candidatus Wallbacteria bacterium]|nr:3-dehydroquinate synthase [Candidatus Wallbacteria bacterium]
MEYKKEILKFSGMRQCIVLTGSGLLAFSENPAGRWGDGTRCAIVTNPVVSGHYLERAREFLHQAGLECFEVIVPDGEQYKNPGTLELLYRAFVDRRLNRSDVIAALGGGVIGDLAGYAAATFKRGLRFVQIPTTLVAQTDAAIGGKNGVNLDAGKNLLGTVYQPEFIFIDIQTLLTLPEREFLSGMAEVIKYALIADSDLFGLLEEKRAAILERGQEELLEVVTRCIAVKKKVVEADEREVLGVREVLNFGHTFGHIAETLTGYTALLHGEAVAIGMKEEAAVARRLGAINDDQYETVRKMIVSYGLPDKLPGGFHPEAVQDILSQDKKIRTNRIRLPVLTGIGTAEIRELKCAQLL